MTTLFGLLFWDVIFAPVAGAFETPYQAAPLDIAEDTFYFSRQEIADARLQEIKNGEGPTILAGALGKYSEYRTCCVGVRWDLFSDQDLLEIADVSPERPSFSFLLTRLASAWVALVWRSSAECSVKTTREGLLVFLT